MYQYAHQVILLAVDAELCLGFNWMAELDVEEPVTLLDWLEPLVVNDQDLCNAMQCKGVQILLPQDSW